MFTGGDEDEPETHATKERTDVAEWHAPSASPPGPAAGSPGDAELRDALTRFGAMRGWWVTEGWTAQHYARMMATAREWGARWTAARDPVAGAAEMIDECRRRGAASSSVLTKWRCLTAVAFYIGMPTRRLALLGRAVRRSEGVVGAAPAIPPHWLEEIIRKLEETETEAADAVIASVVAGGARYQSVLALRRGDITPEGGVVLRRVKVGAPAVRRYFPPPPGSFMAERLAARGAPEPRGRWAARERVWSPALTEPMMAAVAPPRSVRQAVAQLAEGALGGEYASAICGHSSTTRATHYSHRATPEREAWARLLGTGRGI